MLEASFAPRRGWGNRLGQLDVVELYSNGSGAGGDRAADAVAGHKIAQGVAETGLDPIADDHARAQWKLRQALKCVVHVFILSLVGVRVWWRWGIMNETVRLLWRY